jgi:LPS-assembly protein
MLYVPILYYPTKEDGRATGFLLPTYGSSTIRGQSIHNAFFWAINRSQDATIKHDWYSKGGQGVGTEYRYNEGRGSDGDIRAYLLDQTQSTDSFLPASRSFEIRGGANQSLPWNLRARGRVDYFSSIETMRNFNTNVNDASRSQRSFGGNVVGAWRNYSLNATFDRSENFYDATNSVVNGGTPRIAFNRNERQLFERAPVYFSVGSEFANLVRETRTSSATVDSGLARMDVAPQIRFPFKKWQWFTVSSALGWRETFYTRSLDPSTIDPTTNQPGVVVDKTLNRQYFTLSSQIVGPVFNRIWDTPGNGYAERFKHSIEPFFNVQRTSSIDNFDRIAQTDGIDGVVGNATSYTYGVNNRFYAKRKVGTLSQAQEIVDVGLSQSYYSDARQAIYDRQYSTSTTGAQSHFSPLLLSVRVTPARAFDATLRAEVDSTHRALRTLSAEGRYNWTNRVQNSVTWSQKYFIKDLPGFDDRANLDHYLTLSTNAHTADNRFGGLYSFNYNILQSTLLQQRVTGFYNAQCCGIAFDYQTFNFNFGLASVLPADHRFFLSFTLAGLGNFSPFNGAMSGVPR